MLESLARLGYASKALIYAIVGGLAVAAAMNRGGRITDNSGALRVILTQPFGRMLLFVLAAGLCGYALWRILDAMADPDRHGTEFSGLVTRSGNVVRAGVYGALGVEAFRLAQGLGGSKGNEAEMWTARIMTWPMGEWLIGLAGAIIALYGVSQIVSSFQGKVDKTVDHSLLPHSWRSTVVGISQFGVGARGVIISTLGVFLVRAAFQNDPSEVHGTRESMVELAGAISGRWLLLGIGIGLLAYAFDQAVHARCRRIRPVV